MSESLMDYAGEAPADVQGMQGVAAAPGMPAMQKAGIILQGHWRQPADGWSRHTREIAKALAKAGVPIHLDSLSVNTQVMLNDDLPEEARDLLYLTRANFDRTQLVIKMGIWTDYDQLKKLLLPRSTMTVEDPDIERMLSRTVLYTVWERDRVLPKDVELLNRLGQVWVTCDTTRQAFEDSGVRTELLRVVPYCYDPDDKVAVIEPVPPGEPPKPPVYVPGVSSISLPRSVSGIVPKGRRFYSIGRWDPRKNQHRVLGAFLRTFKPTEDATLFLKVSGRHKWSNYPTVEESIQSWLDNAEVKAQGWTLERFRKRVAIVDKLLQDSEIVEIHRRNNIYLSLGHGEGWDVPAFEAKLAGNRIIYTNWGGMKEYADLDDIHVDWDYAPVDTDYASWGPVQWVVPDMQEMQAALRAVRPAEMRVQNPEMYSLFSRQTVGLRMRRYLEELFERVAPDEKLGHGFG
jgi:glycosyltransferase involved in cell wall biosynthesis